jgi:hypothetical protein
LGRILSSRQFANAPKKQKFLQLICDAYLTGRAGELNEYMIGYEVFDRDKTYNPALDPIVRVGAHELRKKLERYYGSEGQNDQILLEIPTGSYIPLFTRRQRPPEAETTESANAIPLSLVPNTRSRKNWISPLNLLLTFLIVSVALLAFSNRQLRRQIEESASAKEIAPAYRSVWGAFLKDKEPALFVLSNPTVYRFWNPADPNSLLKLSIELTPEEVAAREEVLRRERFMMRHGLPARVILSLDEYTGLGEAIGLHRLTTHFNKIGKNIVLRQSRTVSPEDLKNHDVILLGSVWVNEWSGKVLIKEDFINGASATIINENPQPGEKREYSAKFDPETGKLIEDYGLITVKPNISERRIVMVLAGTHSEGTEAATEYITSEDGLNDINQRLQAFGSTPPKYFQALLKVGVDNGIPTTVSVMALHQLHSDRR